MAFDVQLTHFMEFAQLVVSGPSAIGSFVELVNTVEAQSRVWGDTRVLVDLRGVEGRLSDAEEVFLGEMVALKFGHLQKVASVVPADQITRNSEAAAQGLGLQLRVFASRPEAISWLVGRPMKAGATPPAGAAGVEPRSLDSSGPAA